MIKMMKTKMVVFDMDGTIADLYAVPNWLQMLRAEDPTPYAVAEPMWEMEKLADVLNALKVNGIEIRIVTWLSKDSTEEYKNLVRQAKLEWLEKIGFPFDNFHGVQYGATKANSIRKYLAEDETAILFDDNEKVRKGWTLGETVDPTTTNIIEFLENLL